MPVQHLRNLVVIHPAGIGTEGSNHVWDPLLPVFLVNRQASLWSSSLSLLKGMCTCLVCALWVVHTEFYDRSFCLRDQRAVMAGTQTLRHHLLCDIGTWAPAQPCTICLSILYIQKQHGLLANPYRHHVHRAVLEQQMGELKPFFTKPFQLNRKSIAHSSGTWQNSENVYLQVQLFIGHCHHHHQVSQPTLQPFLSSVLKYVSIAACHSHLYIRNFLSCAKNVLR